MLTMATLDGDEKFDASALGTAGEVAEEMVGDWGYLFFRNCKGSKAASILLRVSNSRLRSLPRDNDAPHPLPPSKSEEARLRQVLLHMACRTLSSLGTTGHKKSSRLCVKVRLSVCVEVSVYVCKRVRDCMCASVRVCACVCVRACVFDFAPSPRLATPACCLMAKRPVFFQHTTRLLVTLGKADAILAPTIAASETVIVMGGTLSR